MPYVIRDQNGNITRAAAQEVHGSEYIGFDAPELINFLKTHGQNPDQIDEALSELRRTDTDMSRIIEDVVRALLKKNIIRMGDLPSAVQDKLAYRIKMRVKIEETLDHASHMRQTTDQHKVLHEGREI